MHPRPIRANLTAFYHLPRSSPVLQLARLHLQRRQYASKAPDPKKPIILEQPDAFRPPSHPSRMRRRSSRKLYYGRELSEDDKQELDSKQYPYMFPPDGSMANWVLTSRWLHASIALAVLLSLAIYINYAELKKRNSTRWPDLMPVPDLALRNPVLFVKQYTAVWKLNQQEDTRFYREKMDREAEDLKKARLYRKAHGLPEQAGLAARWGFGTIEEDEDEKAQRLEQEKQQTLATSGVEEGEKKKRKVLFGIWEI